ncbi:hypothetical protein L9F63_015587, partial [Diploptera punctata]
MDSKSTRSSTIIIIAVPTGIKIFIWARSVFAVNYILLTSALNLSKDFPNISFTRSSTIIIIAVPTGIKIFMSSIFGVWARSVFAVNYILLTSALNLSKF